MESNILAPFKAGFFIALGKAVVASSPNLPSKLFYRFPLILRAVSFFTTYIESVSVKPFSATVLFMLSIAWAISSGSFWSGTESKSFGPAVGAHIASV